MSLVSQSGLNPGVNVGIDQVGDIQNIRLELEGLKQDDIANNAASGMQPTTPAATFWVTYRAVKNGVIVVLRHAVDPNIAKLHIVLEEYLDSGGVTVLDTLRDDYKITPDMLSVVGGVTVFEHEFGHRLQANSTYGLLRYATDINGVKRTVYSPEVDPPGRSSRAVADYIATFNSTNGQAIVPQGSSPLNLIYDGSFEYADDSSASVLRWWDTRDGTWTTGTINTTNTNDIWWDQANNCVVVQSKLKFLTIGLGRRLHRSEKISVNFDLWASGSFSLLLELDVNLQSASGTSECLTPFAGTISVTTGIQRINVVLAMKTTYDTLVKHRLKFHSASDLNNDGGGGTGRSIRIGYVMVTRGIEPAPFQYRVDSFETGRVVGAGTPSEDPDVTVTRVIPGNDYGSGPFRAGDGGSYLPT